MCFVCVGFYCVMAIILIDRKFLNWNALWLGPIVVCWRHWNESYMNNLKIEAPKHERRAHFFPPQRFHFSFSIWIRNAGLDPGTNQISPQFTHFTNQIWNDIYIFLPAPNWSNCITLFKFRVINKTMIAINVRCNWLLMVMTIGYS